MDLEAERDFCTREWSRVHKDKTVAVVDWLMTLRASARAERDIEVSVLRTENERLKRALETQEKETQHARYALETFRQQVQALVDKMRERLER